LGLGYYTRCHASSLWLHWFSLILTNGPKIRPKLRFFGRYRGILKNILRNFVQCILGESSSEDTFVIFAKLLLLFWTAFLSWVCSWLLSLPLQYLNLESSFEGKDSVCTRLLRFLVSMATSDGVTEKLSFQLLEALLYRVDLNVFTGRTGTALALLEVTDLTTELSYW